MPDRIGRLWPDLPKPVRHALRGYLRPLVARSRPSDNVAWSQRVTLTSAATPDEILGEIRRADGLAALTGADGAVTLVNLAHVGLLTLEPVDSAA